MYLKTFVVKGQKVEERIPKRWSYRRAVYREYCGYATVHVLGAGSGFVGCILCVFHEKTVSDGVGFLCSDDMFSLRCWGEHCCRLELGNVPRNTQTSRRCYCLLWL